MNIIIKLFLAFFKIGAFSFGGGYAMIPLIMEETIQTHQWISNSEFIDILAISQITPGPIAINMATFLGFRTAFVPGAAAASFAVALPSFLVISALYYFFKKHRENVVFDDFFKGIQPVVVGMVAAGMITVFRAGVKDYLGIVLFAIGFYLVSKRKWHPMIVILLAGVVGLFAY